MARPLKVLIVGAGIGGLAAACALRQSGCEVEVRERSTQLAEAGAGLQLGPNAVRVLNALGFERDLLQIASEPPDMVSLHWDDGRLRHRRPLGAGAEAAFGARYLMVHRADLHDRLRARLPAASVTLGQTCLSCSSGARGAVVEFDGGRFAEADVVIGADGIRSRVRQQLFGADAPRYAGQLGWRALLPMEFVPDRVGPDGVSLRRDFVGFLGPSGHVIMYPIRGGEVLNVFAGYFSDDWAEESWTVPSSRAEMLAAFAGWNGELLEMLSRVESCFKWGLHDRDPLSAWTVGRIALLGDAAHPMMPTLAQGAAIAIEDACALARHLAAGHADPAPALADYGAERQPRASRVQLQARQQYLNNRMVPAPPPLSRDWLFIHDATVGRDWTPPAA